MKQLTVVVDDKVGVIADISYILGKAKINIDSLSAVLMDKKVILNIFVRDEQKASALLKSNGYHLLESEVMVIRLNDEPGELSKVSAMLSEAGVSVANLYILAKEKGSSIISLKVDKPTKAKKLLEPYMNIEG